MTRWNLPDMRLATLMTLESGVMVIGSKLRLSTMRTRPLMGALVSTAILLAGCQENDIVKPKETWHKGDNVEFRARAGYENNGGNDTRTVYTGKTYTIDGKTYERVDWVEGDQIRIFCQEAQNPAEGHNYADYKIVSHQSAGGKEDYGYLERVNPNGSLQWGDPSKKHTFYAFYPSPAQNSQLEMSDNWAKGVVPMEQTPLEITATDGKNYVAKPNMNYAFMTAKAVMEPGSSNEVNLSFKSMVTALELELEGPDQQTVNLTDIRISSDTENLTGPFTCDLDKVATDGYPDCTILFTTDDRHTVNVSLVDENGKPFSLSGGKTLKVTVFLLPLDDYQALKISLQTAKGIKSHDLKKNDGTTMVVKSHLKNLVQRIQVPSNFTANQWLSHMNSNVLLSQLSIPGSGNSYSYTYSGSGNDTIKYKAQSLDIKHQWNLGVRAFEVTADRNEGSKQSSFGLGGLILDNNTLSSTTVAQAVREVYSMLTENRNEFAMMIISYQPAHAGRDGDQFVRDFMAWYNNLDIHTTGHTALFRPGLSIGDVRGKMMFILRPSSVDEALLSEAMLNEIANEDFLVVDGWGSLQDKWKHRGYRVKSQVGFDVETEADWDGCMERTMLAVGTSATVAPTFPEPLTAGASDFSYNTNHSFTAWAQEWPRVVEKDFAKYMNIAESGNYLWVKWRESYNEKLQDAKETFDKSVADKNNQSSVYFNSLCGYFVLEDDNESWKPVAKTYNMTPAYKGWGVTYGNLLTFSERINEDFYKYVLSKSNTQGSLSGPVGVVMINRVGSTEASTLMPNVIISNNFKFPLLTKETAGEKTNGNTYQNGGSAIK